VSARVMSTSRSVQSKNVRARCQTEIEKFLT
jgi:hypothetical protein